MYPERICTTASPSGAPTTGTMAPPTLSSPTPITSRPSSSRPTVFARAITPRAIFAFASPPDPVHHSRLNSTSVVSRRAITDSSCAAVSGQSSFRKLILESLDLRRRMRSARAKSSRDHRELSVGRHNEHAPTPTPRSPNSPHRPLLLRVRIQMRALILDDERASVLQLTDEIRIEPVRRSLQPKRAALSSEIADPVLHLGHTIEELRTLELFGGLAISGLSRKFPRLWPEVVRPERESALVQPARLVANRLEGDRSFGADDELRPRKKPRLECRLALRIAMLLNAPLHLVPETEAVERNRGNVERSVLRHESAHDRS